MSLDLEITNHVPIHMSAFERMRAASLSSYGLSNIDEWICKYTYINQENFGFIDREFQIPIMKDTVKDQIVVKCAQVGLSELSYRWAVAACCIMDNFNVIYTFPTAGDATKNNQTRIDPMIEGSKELSRLVSPHLNNSEIKKFGLNSFLFFKGTMAETAALSTPADVVIHDEYDKSDMDVVTTYVSRLQDRITKIRKIFSTPTLRGYGVDKEAQNANRLFHLVKCVHCNHMFKPDYYNNVVVPGWDKSLEEINARNLHTARWEEAYLSCPKCGKDPEMHHTRMPWVCENPSLGYHKNAWHVSPFSAHKRITVPNLVKNSTEYKKISEFKNQALGLTAEEKNESITKEDVDKMQEQSFAPSSEIHQMGIDVGLICNVTVGRQMSTGELLVQHRERVHYSRLHERIGKLRQQYRISVSVMDSQPQVSLTNEVCQANHNAWGAVYVTSKSPIPFTVREEDENPEDGKMGFRIVNINRNAMFDEVLAMIKNGAIIVNKSDENDVFEKQMLCMKRVEKFTTQNELQFVWVKTGDEEDHYHHSLLYLCVAAQMRHTAGMPGIASLNRPLVRKARVKNPKKVTGGSIWK